MTVRNAVVRETAVSTASVNVTSSRMDYTDSNGSKEPRRKKTKRRRNHRRNEQRELDNDVTTMPSIFRVSSHDEPLSKDPATSEISRLILPKIATASQHDLRQERTSEKREDRRYFRHTLPKIDAAGKLTTGSYSYMSGFDDGEYSYSSKNRIRDD